MAVELIGRIEDPTNKTIVHSYAAQPRSAEFYKGEYYFGWGNSANEGTGVPSGSENGGPVWPVSASESLFDGLKYYSKLRENQVLFRLVGDDLVIPSHDPTSGNVLKIYKRKGQEFGTITFSPQPPATAPHLYDVAAFEGKVYYSVGLKLSDDLLSAPKNSKALGVSNTLGSHVTWQKIPDSFVGSDRLYRFVELQNKLIVSGQQISAPFNTPIFNTITGERQSQYTENLPYPKRDRTLHKAAGDYFIAGYVHADHYSWGLQLYKAEAGYIRLVDSDLCTDLKMINGRPIALINTQNMSGWAAKLIDLESGDRLMVASVPSFARSFAIDPANMDCAYVGL